MPVIGIGQNRQRGSDEPPGQLAWQFAVGTRAEVRKVVWPTRKETVQATLVVIVMVIIVGLYLWLLDVFSFWAIYDLILRASR